MITIEPLTTADADACRPLTFPRYYGVLPEAGADGPAFGVKAANALGPAGLALAYARPGEPNAQLLSLFVAPAQRNAGLGTTLLRRLEETLAAAGCERLWATYSSGPAAAPAFERVLEKRGWEPPRPQVTIFKSDMAHLGRAPWLELPLPEEFSAVPWGELGEAEREGVLAGQTGQPWYPEDLSPFLEPDIMEPLTSVGLRFEGRVIGWMICHRIAEDAIRYSSLFVREEFRERRLGVPLVAAALRRQRASPIARLIWIVSVKNAVMLRLVERYLTPYLTSRSESRGASTTLRAAGNAETIAAQLPDHSRRPTISGK